MEIQKIYSACQTPLSFPLQRGVQLNPPSACRGGISRRRKGGIKGGFGDI